MYDCVALPDDVCAWLDTCKSVRLINWVEGGLIGSWGVTYAAKNLISIKVTERPEIERPVELATLFDSIIELFFN